MFRLAITVTIVGVSLLASACATPSPQQRLFVSFLQGKASEVPFCATGHDCDEKWARAVYFVNRYSSWKIQVQTEQMVQTYGPGSTMRVAYVVNKVPGIEKWGQVLPFAHVIPAC